jgi:hypothetical protein
VNASETTHFHPIANIFPLMEGDEFEALVADISQNGLTDPVVMLDGKILDGRNRWNACQRLGIPHREIKFSDLKLGSDDPTAFVWSKNVMRRQLNAGQIAMAAEQLETLRRGQRPDRVKDETSGEVSVPATRKKIAKETGASAASIDKARRVRRQGKPQLAEAVEKGEITLNAADKIARLPQEEQDEVLKSEKPASAAARKEQARQKRPVTRKAPSPTVTMKGHMTGHQSGIRDVQLVHKYWAEHADQIDQLDPADLRSFIKDLEESRRAASQLLTLLGEKLVPKWTLPGKQPALLSTALNKIDQAESE